MGFLADANALRRAAAASQPAASTPGQPPLPPGPAGANPAPTAQQGEKKGEEQDMLAQFLLDNLQ
jgi:hypothetical protein